MGGHDLLRAWLLNDLGNVLRAQGEKEAAVGLKRKALVLKQKVLGSDHPDVGISEGNLAIALDRASGRHEEALAHVDNAVAIARERALGRSSRSRDSA